MGRHACIVFSLLAVLASHSFPLAAQESGSIEAARQLMVANDAQGAYAILAPLESENVNSPDFNYLLGIAALDSGHITRAIFALERALVLQPSNTLVRAEIARAYLKAGEIEAAKVELSNVRESSIPDAARPAVDRLMSVIGQLQDQQSTQVRSYVEAGLGYDTNVNNGPNASQVAVPALGGLLVTLDSQSRKVSDSLTAVGAGGTVRVPVRPDLAFAGNVALSQTFDHSSDRYNAGVLDINAGVIKSVGPHVFSGTIQGASNRIGYRAFRDAYGLLGQWQYNYNPTLQFTTFGQLTRLHYPGNSLRDADRWLLGAGFGKVLTDGGAIYLSTYTGRESPDSDRYSFLAQRFIGVRSGFEWRSDEKLLFFGNAYYENRRYDGEEPLFSRSRNDEQAGLSVGLHYVPITGWRVTPQVTYTSNASNVEIYKFDRVATTVMLRREF